MNVHSEEYLEMLELNQRINLGKAVEALETDANFKLLANHLFNELPLKVFNTIHSVANDETKRNNAMHELAALSKMQDLLTKIKEDGKLAQDDLEPLED